LNAAIILAGGTGKRFGTDLPKQYTKVLGKPVIAYTLDVFQASPDIDAIAVVCLNEYAPLVKEIARKYGIGKLRWIVPGGESCPESIRNGVFALRNMLKQHDNILLHMSVSPLVTPGDIASSLALCREKGCCFTMHPVNICMARRGSEGWTEQDAPKEDYIELNTPWAFRYADILDLYTRLETENHVLSETDYTLSLWLASGRRAWYCPGNAPGRLKITTPHDMDLFEGYLMLREKRQSEALHG